MSHPRCLAAVFVMISLFAGRMVVGVSAWAPTRAPLKTRSFLSQHSNRPFKSRSSLRMGLNIRGGTSPYSQIQINQFYDTSSALKASLVGKENAASPQSSIEGDFDFYKESLKLDLPVVDFGGLSYWKTTDEGGKQRKFRVLFVLGGPGAGKGTQSALMAKNYPVVHLSVGELLREEQTKEDSPNRNLIQEALVAGKIVPVEVSLELVQNAMEKASLEVGRDILFLVDGFPRNEDNLSGWCHYMKEVASIWSVLFYQCPLEVLEQRILERSKSSGRSDDNLDSIHKRFATFERETMPIIRKLADASSDSPWRVIEIAGNLSLDDVWLATQEALNELIRHDVLSANAQLLTSIEQGDVVAYQNLCDPLWFKDTIDPLTVLEKQEGLYAPTGTVHDAELEFVSGKHVAVTYTRTLEGQNVRENRIWVYEGLAGWRNIHFARTPIISK